ncbi:MAG: hypothetical protein Q8933_20130, partial [Bacteroidota bacterium]|nr:hypothetical protein [Bacteroidota bacterium]
MKHYLVIASIFAMATFTASCTNAVEKKNQSEITSLKENVQKKTLEENLKDFLKDLKAGKMGIIPFNNPKLDTVIVDSLSKTICININGDLSTLPFREKLINDLYTNVKSYIGEQYKSYTLSIKTKNIPIEDLIPNFYRTDKSKLDLSRLPKSNFSSTKPVVDNISKPFSIDKGLYNRNILLWHSHGWYYNNDLDRWEWQRPRLFESVEDKVPMSFVLPYLLPMLENAGANVFIPRERDFQINEVITDNDSKPNSPKKPEYKEASKNRKNRWL